MNQPTYKIQDTFGDYSILVPENQVIKHYPPQVGEYAYFDCRMYNDNSSYMNVPISTQHKLIGIRPDTNRYPFGCHWSSPINYKISKYITNHGMILRVKNE